jgi:flagella basal body P-ring formation protein FlgA
MIRLLIRFALLSAVPALHAAATTAPACHAVKSSQITAADLAALLPAFAAISPETPFGYAPQPGSRRNIEPAELTRFAAAHGVAFHGIDTVCFEPLLRELDPLTIEVSIRESLKPLGITNADIEIAEFSMFPVPSGPLMFPAESLPAYSADATAIWNGFVEHEHNRYPVWARVKIQAVQTRIVAANNLRAGQTINAGDIRPEEARGFPTRAAGLKSVSEGIGMMARRYINAGTPIGAADLIEPFDIGKGEMVAVEVQSGAAVLTLEAEAQSDGRVGQMIPLRNVASGRIFRARVTGKRHALLEFSSPGA